MRRLPILSRRVWCNRRGQCYLTLPPSYVRTRGREYYIILVGDVLVVAPARLIEVKAPCELLEEAVGRACW